jgi:asparagine synthase (glutamine-hydrolysing)
MGALMVHRGPDASGLFTAQAAAGTLGHQRLSIMDPDGGDQPIRTECGTAAIAANGEIYNFPELADTLRKRHTFRTRSDSESILHLYRERGIETASRLDGMFAFALADNNDLFLARDPIGIKPLYYGHRDGSMVFSSELKALAGKAPDVAAFPPGTWYHSQLGFRTYYQVPDRAPREATPEEHARYLRQTLESAVQKRLMSDVPLGAFLSGGLDSSIIVAMMRPHVDELHTFSVGTEGSPDLEAARLVSRHVGTIHHEYILTQREIEQELSKIIYHLESFDRDLVRSAIPCYFTSRLAADYVKVILTGEGADELFAGYTYYKNITDGQTLHDELRRSVTSLHDINLQRVDRMTMAHSLEGRVPFLDTAMIEMAQSIPPELKLLRRDGKRPLEKWILRKATEDLLPQEIVWRDKEQFDEGSGSVDLLSAVSRQWMATEDAAAYAETHPDQDLRCEEECHYHRILCDAYGEPETVLSNVARWAEPQTVFATASYKKETDT